ncbi:hypothetical protein C8R44DRAFT_736493 [Mycena epipterygia]|nr:hypothetical protein C8R44DRAFT_736493 [Mycena epipterygia]
MDLNLVSVLLKDYLTLHIDAFQKTSLSLSIHQTKYNYDRGKKREAKLAVSNSEREKKREAKLAASNHATTPFPAALAQTPPAVDLNVGPQPGQAGSNSSGMAVQLPEVPWRDRQVSAQGVGLDLGHRPTHDRFPATDVVSPVVAVGYSDDCTRLFSPGTSSQLSRLVFAAAVEAGALSGESDHANLAFLIDLVHRLTTPAGHAGVFPTGSKREGLSAGEVLAVVAPEMRGRGTDSGFH